MSMVGSVPPRAEIVLENIFLKAPEGAFVLFRNKAFHD